MKKVDGVIGWIGLAAGLVGAGYAICMRSKMAKIGNRLDRSIDELAGKTPIDIPSDMVERAVEKAVANEVRTAVSRATSDVMTDINHDIRRQVGDAVEKEYQNIKDSVLKQIVDEAAKIDAKRVRDEVERVAKNKALEKFENDLDDILEDYKDNLHNVSKIYKTFADAVSPSNHKETVLHIR